MISPAPLSGSLLLTPSNWKPAAPESESVSTTDVFTGTSLLSGGQSTFGDASQVSVGGVLSMLMPSSFIDTELELSDDPELRDFR
jgi:hypothetical protein